MVNPVSVGIDFKRQNLTATDVRIGRLKVDLRAEKVNYL